MIDKWIFSADWHITTKTPRTRTDDYPQTQFEKISWICNLANEKEAAILVSGDIFDRPACPLPWLYRYMDLFFNVEKGIYCCFGQHDIHFHNPDLSRTPLGILLRSGAVKNASDVMHQCNFGEELPELDNKKLNWLCAHIPVTKYKPPFYMEDAFSAKDFMFHAPEFDVIITGDYHDHHITEDNGQLLINPGSIMRNKKNDAEYIPKVVYLDDETIEPIEIPHEKAVFDFDKMDADDIAERRNNMREFADNMEVGTTEARFEDNLRKLLNDMELSDGARAVIDEVMEEINE